MTRLWVMSFFEVRLRTCLKNHSYNLHAHVANFDGIRFLHILKSLVLRYVPGLIYNNNIM